MYILKINMLTCVDSLEKGKGQSEGMKWKSSDIYILTMC